MHAGSAAAIEKQHAKGKLTARERIGLLLDPGSFTVITRKAYGGAYDVMGSKHLGDLNLAWPTAQIAVMGAQGAVNILYRRELAAAQDPGALCAERTRHYEDTLANPYTAAERGYIDAVIRPAETRTAITRALVSLRTKRETLPPKKHGNIPL